MTALSASSTAPSPAVVESLFDLTQSEVFFASALAQGRTVSGASRKCGLKASSGRTYLARIFAKTRTHRQAELVAASCVGAALSAAAPRAPYTPSTMRISRSAPPASAASASW